MGTFAALATSSYASTTGWAPADMATWVTLMMKLFYEAPLVVLDKAGGWIMASLFILTVIYFSTSGLHFFKS